MADCILKLLFALLFALVIVVRSEGVFQCPPPSEVSPCTCSASTRDNTTGSLSCSAFNQRQLSNFITQLKAANPNMTKLQVDYLFLQTLAPNLTSLDLTPLTGCTMNSLYFDASTTLTSILRSTSSGKMDVASIYLRKTPLSNLDVGNILTYVNSSSGPIRINIENNPRFTGNSRGSPIIPGLSSFPKLTTLTFVNTSIHEVLSSAFAGSQGLRLIELSHNNITKLEKDAFTIDHNVQNETLRIDLDNNLLTSDNSSIQPGFIPELKEAKELGYFLYMRNNSLTTLPEGTFKNLLFPGGRVFELQLAGNQFVCDDGMQWIKSGKDVQMWKTNVLNADCTNDPGKDIFTTDLVKSGANALFQFHTMSFVIVIFTSLRFIFL